MLFLFPSYNNSGNTADPKKAIRWYAEGELSPTHNDISPLMMCLKLGCVLHEIRNYIFSTYKFVAHSLCTLGPHQQSYNSSCCHRQQQQTHCQTCDGGKWWINEGKFCCWKIQIYCVNIEGFSFVSWAALYLVGFFLWIFLAAASLFVCLLSFMIIFPTPVHTTYTQWGFTTSSVHSCRLDRRTRRASEAGDLNWDTQPDSVSHFGVEIVEI